MAHPVFVRTKAKQPRAVRIAESFTAHNPKPWKEIGMSNNNLMLRAVKVLLWVFCIYHVITGLGVNVAPAMMKNVASAYGASVDLTPQFAYLGKMFGAYMVVIGLLAGAAALDPVKHRLIVNGIILLFVLRVVQRLVFINEIQSTFGISAARDLSNAAFFLAFAAALFGMSRSAVPKTS
jgi:hypothetical protein